MLALKKVNRSNGGNKKQSPRDMNRKLQDLGRRVRDLVEDVIERQRPQVMVPIPVHVTK